MMKAIFYSLLFLMFAVAIIFIGDKYYDVYHAPSNVVNASEKQESNNAIATFAKVTGKKSQNSTEILVNTPPHFEAGFDWSLPSNTQRTKNSGLVAEDGNNPMEVANRFIIVRWDETNPRQGQYDFSKLDATLNKIAPNQALIRLEVNSSCEAPKWALKKIRQTKQKSLIYWDKSYMDLTRYYIQNFAKRYAANPQIIGVQLGLADGEFGEAADSCDNYSNKRGWGEFWMTPAERQEVEDQFGFNPEVFEKATIANIDIYAKAFGEHKHKLAFTNIGTLFTYGEGADPYNKNLKTIAQYAFDIGLGNRDGAIERWMSYTDKNYGNAFITMPDGSCVLDVNEDFMNAIRGRYWGTENEFYGDKDYVVSVMGPIENIPYRFVVSSLRTLQMRRNFMTISNIRKVKNADYKIQQFTKYLSLTMGKQIEDTPDVFALMGERYIAPSRLQDQMDVPCVRNNKNNTVKVRSFGRWLLESPENTQVENQAALKVRMPESENYWYQGYYLPDGIDYEYSARQAKQFNFDLNDRLSQKRCNIINTQGCEVEVKATFKDTVKTNLQIKVAEGVSQRLQTLGDNKIKTANFKINSKFANQLRSTGSSSGSTSTSDISLISDKQAIPLILMRINFLD